MNILNIHVMISTLHTAPEINWLVEVLMYCQVNRDARAKLWGCLGGTNVLLMQASAVPLASCDVHTSPLAKLERERAGEKGVAPSK